MQECPNCLMPCLDAYGSCQRCDARNSRMTDAEYRSVALGAPPSPESVYEAQRIVTRNGQYGSPVRAWARDVLARVQLHK